MGACLEDSKDAATRWDAQRPRIYFAYAGYQNFQCHTWR
jgi:hypothetical protein